MKTRWAALVGNPVEHSLSPLIYRAFAYALETPIHYSALNIRPRKLESSFLAARTRPWAGWNVTLPHKVALFNLADDADISAKTAGATNLLSFSQGRAKAYNTDTAGFLIPLKRRNIALKGKRALVLGAGGAARAVGAALTAEEAGKLVFINRTPEKAEELAGLFNGSASELNDQTLEREIQMADIVINATSVGLDGESSPLSSVFKFKQDALAYDLIYRPAMTPFLKHAESGGASLLGGLEMLIAQAAAAWKIWFDEDVPEDVSSRVLKQLENKLDENS
jgi:shikimate dehydrogenase